MGALRGSLGGLLAAAALLAVPSWAQAQTVTVSGPSSLAEDVQHPLPVSYTWDAPAGGTIQVFLRDASVSCAPNAPTTGALFSRVVAPGSSGSDTYNGSIFEESAPRTRLLCAYLGSARDQHSISIFDPSASVSVDLQLSLGTGAVEGGFALASADSSGGIADRRMWVYARGNLSASAPSCAPTAEAEQDSGGDLVFTTVFLRNPEGSDSFVVPGYKNVVCAYIGETVGDSVLRDQASFNADVPTFSGLSIEAGAASVVEDSPIDLIVRLQDAEVQRTLFLTVQNGGTGCAATAAEQLLQPGTTSAGGQTIGVGSRIVEPFRPSAPGTWRACAYVSATDGRAPDLPPVSVTFTALAPQGTLAVPVPDAVSGQPAALSSIGTVDTFRRVFTFVGPDRACAPTALAESGRPGVGVLTPEGGAAVGPGAFNDVRRVQVTGTTPFRVCSYLAEVLSAPPLAVASTLVTPRPAGSTPPGTTPPGLGPDGKPLPPGVGGPLDIDPGPIPASIGRQAKGSFWVNNTVLPPGITAARFVELAKRSGQRWGYTFRGVTSKGAAKRDGRRIVGFSSAVTPTRVGSIVRFRRRAARPAGCGRSTAGRCRVRYVTVERDIALARKLTTFWDGADHPPADRYDVESVLLRLFGSLAGNAADKPACANTPLLRTTGVTPGWWWRSPADFFRPRCPTPSS